MTDSELERDAARSELQSLRLQFEDRISSRVAEINDEQRRWFADHLNDERDDAVIDEMEACAVLAQSFCTGKENCGCAERAIARAIRARLSR
jgi:hypothetical protein